MIDSSPYVNDANERQATFRRRTLLFGGLTGVGLLALGARLSHLQIIQADRYKQLAEHNRFVVRLIAPSRGAILDRNGVILAANRPTFRVLLESDKDSDFERTLAKLSELAPLDQARRARLADEIAQAPVKTPVAVLEDLTWEEFCRVNVRAIELPGVTADMGEVRMYPYGGAVAHVVGYVSKVNAKDISKVGPNADPILLNPGFRIGKQGVEKGCEALLRGKAGIKKVEVDVKGRIIRDDPDNRVPPTPGAPLHLTLDLDLQNKALEVFGEDSGGAVLMDCRNGDILCLTSAPSFDANMFVTGVSGPEFRALSAFDHKPFFNKAITATYPPGSTFKTMVALAALESGVEPSRTYLCRGKWDFGNHLWHCDAAHGEIGLHNAIKASCDIYFYQLALAVGSERIAATARQFGLGQMFDIGLPGQKVGVVPDSAYKKKFFPKDPFWHIGETPNLGIGQGYVAVNALQLAVQAARIANGGKMVQPRLVSHIGDVAQPVGAQADLPFSPDHLAFIRAAMTSVVNDPGGTAYRNRKARLNLGPLRMAGKTGTAQSHSYGAVVEKTRRQAWAKRDHSWFIAFAPADQPIYAMSVLVEHGGTGAEAAAPKAAQLMRAALLKSPEIQARLQSPPPAPTPAAPGPARLAPPQTTRT